MYLALWESRRWRLPATPALIFPVAVSLKRFLAPDFVFSFGISLRSDEAPSSGVLMSRPGMPWARRLRRVGLIEERGPDCKTGQRPATFLAMSSAGRTQPKHVSSRFREAKTGTHR